MIMKDRRMKKTNLTNQYLSYIFVSFCVHVSLCLGDVTGRSEEFAPETATFDELFFHMQRYATTDTKKEHKKIAREELFSRKSDGLRYLINHVHIENMWFRIYAQQLVQQLEAEEAVPVLMECLDAVSPNTRKYAAYFLGFYQTPEYAKQLMPLLKDEKTVGSVIRTWGKWSVHESTLTIVPYLKDKKERRRILAANALRDIGDDRAIPFLIAALDDPYFTVRKTVARALITLREKNERSLIKALNDADITPLRELIQILGHIRSIKAVASLRKLLKHQDKGVCGDAINALKMIHPRRSKKWLHSIPVEQYPQAKFNI